LLPLAGSIFVGFIQPKRLRYFLHHDARLVNAVLGIFLAEVEAALNAHLHFHCFVIDGVFSAAEEAIRFLESRYHESCSKTKSVRGNMLNQPPHPKVLGLWE
jgi:hypothetical protein